ncbi:UDP-N-acetylglucosamine 2-epimerase (non-hydrolyzing) [Paludibacter sp. 221]|uniref:non-hydrolyzing UDP-N-acetylglucosamine 2-epimerase n=1 Tax=Paludibacter sp. 221 TaxID=2302939 RepID=UPI0013D43FF9|nr:UDP-N-acetylglucosamine 2-epimerase (non-hydrolyzing) [Paludibacter sp. 221]NDV46042.1 UDP-N-acetylglucosamine 2-epimerase (non-hydrolyzing) [Paludibacter sp. 221]
MIKILTIIGARPQIIKAAALSRVIQNKFSNKIEEKILHTGQHYDTNMSAVFFEEMNIPQPHFNLNIGSGSHGEQTAKMIAGIEDVLLNEKFNAIVLFGDTNSTLAGAIAASKVHIPIIHIEAGLRSFNMAMPEEINRIVCDQLSTLLFAPTETAIENLKNEGFCDSKAKFADGRKREVFNSGDIMYDNSLYYASIAPTKTDIINKLDLQGEKYILATIHRNNNTDDPHRLKAIFDALINIAETNDILIVLPIHPRTKKILEQVNNADIAQRINNCSKIKMIPPASFFEIIELEKNAQIVMTDSGGVQKEAYFFKKPCVILRPETEWVEIIQQNAGIVTDADTTRIVNAYNALTNRDIKYAPVFGDGNAAEYILNKIIEVFE